MNSALVFEADVGPASSVSAQGLHGHLLEGGVVVALLAECVGTCILVLTIIGTAIAASLARPVARASLRITSCTSCCRNRFVQPCGGARTDIGCSSQSSLDGRACHQWWFRVGACYALRRGPALWLCRCSAHRLGALWQQSQDRREFGGHISSAWPGAVKH